MSWFDLEPINPIKRKQGRINQCHKCFTKWEPGTHLTARGEERKTCPHCGSRETTIGARTNPTDIVVRADLLMLTSDRYPDEFCPSTTTEELLAENRPVATYGPAKLFISRGLHPAEDGHYAYLYENNTLWMTSWKAERKTMLISVMYNCPPKSRVFVAGLGLGIVLLYLAAARKTTEVIVAEISENIIGLIEPIIRPWLARKYPDFKWTLIHGDALEEVKKHGKFDWIFFDIWKNTTVFKDEPTLEKAYEASKDSLTQRGRFDSWIDAIKAYGLR